MTRLTREVRFAIPLTGQAPAVNPPNGLSGNLMDAPAMYLSLQVTLGGEIDPASNFIENITTIDEVVRSTVVSTLTRFVQDGNYTLTRATQAAGAILQARWPRQFARVRLSPSGHFWCEVASREQTMVYVTQRFEFSAAHRLDNPALDEQRNREVFGKCNNPAGHGHNYEFEVTLAGTVGQSGRLIDQDEFAEIVNRHVIARFDHKNLNAETSEFASAIPSVENIARVIHDLLAGQFHQPTQLHRVRVWETGKTWAEYVP
jgi:6-pyruvoyltetrahydropterin/6-carboxytetrahydropterin synthase